MSSPKIQPFFVYDNLGVPLTGAAGGLSFDTYKRDDGTNLSQPSFVEIGGGAYKFTPTFPTDHSIVYIINTGGFIPRRIEGSARPEDFYVDQLLVMSGALDTLRKIESGRWKIDTSARTMTFYDDDGTTPLFVYDLKDSAGAASATDVFERIPQ